ncbi:hypothetical protein NECAME_00069 [Necator americanus]|uniref:XK-related protein n=1 Tax=Necator americanus TaxID=51031 RepID=W2TYQ6_NECAM|nr:hypothetical protein NECAME_00069 [Necator americanus]ETN87210.1 hypothetical protein NECAME_00069 [Necator americanus]
MDGWWPSAPPHREQPSFPLNRRTAFTCSGGDYWLFWTVEIELEKSAANNKLLVMSIFVEYDVGMFEKHPAKLIYLTENGYASDQEDGGVAAEQLDRIPRQLFVRRFDLFCFCFAMVTYCFDIISDLITAAFHYYDGRDVACLFILLLSVVPSIVLNAVSFAWICDDNQAKARKLKSQGNQSSVVDDRESYVNHALMCIFQVGPLWWYYKALIYGIQFRMESDAIKRRKHFCRMIEAERDATLLRFFEGFLESAPQLIIQGNILSEYLWWHFDETDSIFDLPRWGG